MRFLGFSDSGPATGNITANCVMLNLNANFNSTGPVQMVGTTSPTFPSGTNTLRFTNASYVVTDNGTDGTASGTGTPLPSVTAAFAPGDYDVSVLGTGPSSPPPTPTGSVTLDDGVDTCTVTLPADLCPLPDEVAGQSYAVTASYTTGDSNYASFTDGTATVEVDVGLGAQTGPSSDGVSVNTTLGGSRDSVSEIAYGTDPVGALTDGTNYFDVAVSQPSGFGTVVVEECNSGVTMSTTLDWWDTTTNTWKAVTGVSAPTYPPCMNGWLSVSYTLSDSAPSDPTLAQLNHTVFGVVADGPAIDSSASADATTTTSFSQLVTTVG